MKKVLFSLFMLGTATASFAQTSVTISQVQTVSAANLAACKDSSSLVGQIVKVTGVVVADGNLAVNGAGTSVLGNTWIQSGTGPWSGLDIFGGSTSGVDVLLAGDSVEITGTVMEFGPTNAPQVETELATVTAVNVLSSGHTVNSNLVNLGDINDNAQANLLPTGEQWEGAFVELQNVTVTAVVPFVSGGVSRVSFNVSDANGNMINVSDRFKVQKLPGAGGTFVPPAIGTTFCSLKGVLMHSPNGCKNYSSGRGYELHPFEAAHYGVCAGGAYPQISAIANTPMVPTPAQTVTVSATITDADGTVTGAKVFYAVGATNLVYDSVAMTNVGSAYSATLPAQVNNSFVKYYIAAVDNDNHRTVLPNVPSSNPALAYVVKNGPLEIYDLQYTPFTDGNSIFKDKTVTVTGVVTASAEATNLGYVFIQQEGGLLGWAGIMCVGNTQLALLQVGDKVTVTGDVKESFGLTRIENISALTVAGTGVINPLSIDPSTFATYAFANNEAYESMLITLKNPNPAKKLYVIGTTCNPITPNTQQEYRIGKNGLLPDDGCRVSAGRQTNSIFSSLNVSYVNDATWATTDGIMNVTPIVVAYGDSLVSVTGIMYYGFGNMKLLPRNNADFVSYNAVAIDPILSQNSQIKAFPSPASDVLHVNYNFPHSVSAQITLTDMLGRTVATQNITGTNGESTISLQNVPSGTYILRVNSENAQVFAAKVAVVK